MSPHTNDTRYTQVLQLKEFLLPASDVLLVFKPAGGALARWVCARGVRMRSGVDALPCLRGESMCGLAPEGDLLFQTPLEVRQGWVYMSWWVRNC